MIRFYPDETIARGMTTSRPERAALPDQDPAIDANSLERLRKLQDSGGADLLPVLVSMFEEDSGARLALLRAAIAEADAPTAEHVAHALQGSCAIFGARLMEQLCGRLQATARTADLASAPRLLDQLEGEFERVSAALQDELRKSPAPRGTDESVVRASPHPRENSPESSRS